MAKCKRSSEKIDSRHAKRWSKQKIQHRSSYEKSMDCGKWKKHIFTLSERKLIFSHIFYSNIQLCHKHLCTQVECYVKAKKFGQKFKKKWLARWPQCASITMRYDNLVQNFRNSFLTIFLSFQMHIKTLDNSNNPLLNKRRKRAEEQTK